MVEKVREGWVPHLQTFGVNGERIDCVDIGDMGYMFWRSLSVVCRARRYLNLILSMTLKTYLSHHETPQELAKGKKWYNRLVH